MDYLQRALHTFNGGNWYGWKKVDSDGNKIPNDQRMCYECIEIIKDGATIPSEADVNAKIQELKDAETDAITKDIDPSFEPASISNNSCVKKYYVDVEKCFEYWIENSGDCGNCIAVCPFSKIKKLSTPSEFWK